MLEPLASVSTTSALAETVRFATLHAMSTLAEIEQAIEQLPEREVAELRAWLSQRDPRPALAKWRKRGTGIVQEMGGVDAYLSRVRGSDDNSR